VADAGTLTVIETAQAGWNSVTNAADATLGSLVESDEDLRLRREVELRRAGAAAVDAIEADLSAVTGVTSVRVFRNVTDVTDGDGMPPHSVEALVLGGDDNAVAQAVWDNVAGGIQAYGEDFGTAVDRDSVPHTVAFTRPTETPLYLAIEVTKNTDPLAGPIYPTNGDTLIAEALAAWAQDHLRIGSDLIFAQLYGVIFGVDGVLDVTSLKADDVYPPTGTVNIVIAARALGTIDTGNVEVT
jgi:uncharacterized phage protein gp47/JayE